MADGTSSSKSEPPKDSTQSPIEDPALNPVHYHHSSRQHTTVSEKSREDENVYPKDVSLEKGAIADPDAQDTKYKDLEEAGSSPPTQAWYKRGPYWRYLSHWKRAFFIVIWLLFTG